MEGFYSYDDDRIELPPGFRFHPTDEELVTHYLSPKVLDHNFTTKSVGEVDLNKVEPWDLPWRAKMGEKEWYFFCVKDRKYPTGSRTNRATGAGYWKATGKDKAILRGKMLVGMKKTLVFYRGRAPKGEKTNWVMHEYRLEGKYSNSLPKEKEWVICRVFKKSSGGNRVPISGLVRIGDSRLDLPLLKDVSSDENTTAPTDTADGLHVTCVSNEKSDTQNESVNKYCSSSIRKFNCPTSVFSNQLDSCTENFQCPDSILKQETTTICHLFKTNSSSFMKQSAAAEFPQYTGVNAEMPPTISKYEYGIKPRDDNDQDFPIVSTGEIDLDFLWNY